MLGREVLFPNGKKGIVTVHRPPIVFVLADMERLDDIQGPVRVLDRLASISHSLEYISACVEEDMSSDSDSMKRAIFAPIPQVKDIALINNPMLTGITMIDALAPIGRGQNMLLIGHDITDMRGYICDFLSVQKESTKCIYAATSEKDVIKRVLSDAGLLDSVTLVAHSSKEDMDDATRGAEATTVAATACAIAESFALEKGLNTLVIVDTIDQHKVLWVVID